MKTSNMRTIKFRAWDKQDKKYRHLSDLSWMKSITGVQGLSGVVVEMDQGHDKFRGIEEVEIEQFTGLLDKDGKEIYEGDILGMPLQGISKVGGLFGKHFQWCAEVFWLVDRWTIHKNERGRDWKHSTPIDYYTEQTEVIGNIHENPDLLKLWNPIAP